MYCITPAAPAVFSSGSLASQFQVIEKSVKKEIKLAKFLGKSIKN